MIVSTWRRPAAVLGAAVLVSALPFIATTAPAVADTAVDKTVPYSCDLFVSLTGDPIPSDASSLTQDNLLQVGVSFSAPDLVAGATIPETPVTINLNLGKADGSGLDLHTLAVSVLNGDLVTGSSPDADLTLRPATGESKKYRIGGLSVTELPIPQDVNTDWTIPITSGLSPKIDIPNTSSVDLLAPDFFTVPATIISKGENGDPDSKALVRLDCTAASDADRLLSTLSVAAAPTPDPTDDPTTDPTDDPTTDPTDDPTDDPTVSPIDDGGNTGDGSSSGDVSPVNATTDNGALPNTGAPEQLAMIGALGLALVVGGGLVARRRTMIARHKA